ncbi:MAG: pyridoxal phosphate-dependent aminotransferase [Spirochaetia bacterium]
MSARLAERTKAIQASPIRKIFDMASKMEGLTRLEVGQPDFHTPEYILEESKSVLKEGFIGYSPTNGLSETREAVAYRLKEDYGVEYDPNSEVVVTHGASGALHFALRALVNPGDEVLRPDPGFASYDGIIRDADGEPVLYPLLPRENFAVDIDALEKLISKKTKVIMLNSPSNPTGGVLDTQQLLKINALAEKHDLYILSDEAYDKVIYDKEHVPTVAAAQNPSRVITVGSASKDYAMCGWRVGFAAGSSELIGEIIKFQSLANICPNILAQKAYTKALTGPQADTERMRKEYQSRRDYFVKALNDIPGFKCTVPDGAFYVFVDISEHNEDDWAFAEYLLKEVKITSIPGSSFGPTGRGFIRFSYATSLETLKEAVEKMKKEFSP